MELEEIKDKRDGLQNEIWESIRKFEQETGITLKPNSIGFNTVEMIVPNYPIMKTGVFIKIEI